MFAFPPFWVFQRALYTWLAPCVGSSGDLMEDVMYLWIKASFVVWVSFFKTTYKKYAYMDVVKGHPHCQITLRYPINDLLEACLQHFVSHILSMCFSSCMHKLFLTAMLWHRFMLLKRHSCIWLCYTHHLFCVWFNPLLFQMQNIRINWLFASFLSC